MEKSDLVKILNGDITRLFQVKLNDHCDPKIEVVIEPQHIRSILIAFLNNEINSSSLCRWAEFIFIHRKSFILNDSGEEWIEYYKKMWDIIEELSSPSIYGEITHKIVSQYLSVLEKHYFKNEKPKLKKEDLIKILNGDIAHLEKFDPYDLCEGGVEILIMPEQVKKIILYYLNSEITSTQLTKWAEFLYAHCGEYVIEDIFDDDCDKYYDAMWQVIEKLSTPHLDGKITPERVLNYLFRIR